jgi:Protein of unknown function (DUF3159)
VGSVDAVSEIASTVRAKPLLVARCPLEAAESEAPEFSKPAILLAVGRRGIPHLLEATLLPALLFYVLVIAVNGTVAMIGALAWAFVAIGRRLVLGHHIPSILLLATLGITVRTLVALPSGSMFAYFVQPIATTVALAAVFIGSVFVGKPVISRLAHDFCPISPDVASRPEVMRLFAGLTVLWAGVHLLTAATTFGMLVSLPIAVFIPVKTITSLAITAAAVVLTVSWSLRIARRENLVFSGTFT